MPHRRAYDRLRRLATRLPALLLSGLCLFVTTGVPGPAVAAPSRGPSSVETSDATAADASVVAMQELTEAATSPMLPTPEPGLVPPPCSGTVAGPLDRNVHLGGGRVDRGVPQAAGLAAHPDRGPPGVGQQ